MIYRVSLKTTFEDFFKINWVIFLKKKVLTSQVLLQNLLALPTPIYHHHRLIRDDNGKRLAKRDDARAISKYRDDGHTPKDIRLLVGL